MDRSVPSPCVRVPDVMLSLTGQCMLTGILWKLQLPDADAQATQQRAFGILAGVLSCAKGSIMCTMLAAGCAGACLR